MVGGGGVAVVFEASPMLVVKLITVLQLFQPNLDLLTQLLNCWLFWKKDSSQLFIPKSAQFWFQIHIIINTLKTFYFMLKNYFCSKMVCWLFLKEA